MLTDAEILEFEQLLAEQEIDILKDGLQSPGPDANPNYKLLYNAITSQKWGFDEKGHPVLLEGCAGCLLEGSSRAGKTWAGVDIIIWLCLFVEESCTINIYRETYNEFKTTLYDDFRRRLDDFGLPNPFRDTKEIKSFKIGGNTIYFLGDGKQGGGCDYAFYNEIMEIPKEVFMQSKMRCRKFWWADYNPSYTDHWVFENVLPRPDVGYLRTTFLDNPFISAKERLEILSYEPWLPGSYQVTDDGVFYKGEPISDKNLPPPHSTNLANGTADEFMWMVYGLGLRGAMKGVIFPQITWIDKFPEMGYIYANDFGFTCFSRDTLITTSKGDRRIDTIKKGDLVLTRKGFKKVLELKDNGYDKVIEKEFDCDFGYRKISATFNHKFKVKGQWKKFGQLTEADYLYILSSSTETSTEDIPTANILKGILENGWSTGFNTRSVYIMLFIFFIKEKYLKGCISIISTVMRLIMIFQISKRLRLRNTLKYTSSLKSIWKPKNQKETGERTDIERITGNKGGKSFFQNLKKRQESANLVQARLLPQIPIKDFAQKSAIMLGSIRQRKMKQLLTASNAVKSFKEINTENRKLAATNVHINLVQPQRLRTIKESVQRVYDLHVEDCHEYFANGILVHNCDPNAFGRYSEDENNVYFEPLIYEPIETPEDLGNQLLQLGVETHLPIACDSSDKYTGENKGTVEMVQGLYDLGWEGAFKISKTKSVMYWLLLLKKKRIHIVKNHLWKHVKRERENYRYKEVNGIQINKPEDKFNHIFDCLRYGFMAWNDNVEVEVEWD